MSEETIWLTPEAHRKLVEELEEMTTTGRRYLEEKIAEARSHGDIKENADYDAAKNEQGLAEARIRHIKHMLDNAEVREAVDTGKVEVGSLVEISNDTMTLKLLVASKENRVEGLQTTPPESPLAKAILGAEVGQKVSYDAPGGTFTYTVDSIEPWDPS
jgi:transcription elongation factor GreA